MSRAAVFEHVPPLLKQYGGTADVHVITDARVQLLKFEMGGLQVDLVPLPVDSQTAPSDATLDEVTVFDTVASDCRISLNGIRTAVAFRRLFESARVDVPVFSRVLRALKTWAKVRLVYGHNYCYPSSVGYAVMLLKVVQQQPLCATTELDLFRAFFAHYGGEWATSFPRLALVSVNATLNPHPQLFRRWSGIPDSWDADAAPSAAEPLVVLTPSYPHVNSCHTTNASAARLVLAEFMRVRAFFDGGFALPGDPAPWRSLFVRPGDFMDGAAGAVLVTVSAPTKAGLVALAGFAESKVRYLWYVTEAAGLATRLFPGRVAHVEPPRGTSQHAVMFVLRVSPATGARQQRGPEAIAGLVQGALMEFAFFISGVPPTARVPEAPPISTRYVPRQNPLFARVQAAVAAASDDAQDAPADDVEPQFKVHRADRGTDAQDASDRSEG